ncbi:TATA box-binding protein-like protein 1 [Cichlidogyrus casuarinus]|uniref:TATA box-binding protein-like protein 1 n=1 Tax=Cichlidogyrus casuarinus TaxID=1844966 RepID=A0ABD2PQW3_9PLAT
MNIHGSTSLKLFSTGRMVIMGSSMDSIQEIVSTLVPMAAKHQTDEPVSEDDEYYYRNNKGRKSKRRHRRDESPDGFSDSEPEEAASNGGSDSHMRNWSTRRALKDAKKNMLPQLPKEVIAAELDNDYFVDYDDEDNSDLEGLRGDDSDAEEEALMKRRIMRGETLDDYDSSDDEQPRPTASQNQDHAPTVREMESRKVLRPAPLQTIRLINSQQGLDQASKKALCSSTKVAKIISFNDSSASLPTPSILVRPAQLPALNDLETD